MNPIELKAVRIRRSKPKRNKHLYAIQELNLKIHELNESFNRAKLRKEESEKQIAYLEEKIRFRKDSIYQYELNMKICESKSKSLNESLDLLKSERS